MVVYCAQMFLVKEIRNPGSRNSSDKSKLIQQGIHLEDTVLKTPYIYLIEYLMEYFIGYLAQYLMEYHIEHPIEYLIEELIEYFIQYFLYAIYIPHRRSSGIYRIPYKEPYI